MTQSEHVRTESEIKEERVLKFKSVFSHPERVLKGIVRVSKYVRILEDLRVVMMSQEVVGIPVQEDSKR